MSKINCILLVDDDETTNFFHKYIIKKTEKFNLVEECINGQEALDFLQNENKPKPNIILLDVNMPVMDGFEFLEEYKKLEDRLKADVVVCMLTTSLHPKDEEKARKFDLLKGYYNKPLNEEIIEKIINDYQNKY